MKFDKNVIALSAAIIIVVFMISGCDGISSGNNLYNRKYYQGYDSLQLSFLTDSPPSTFPYDPTSTQNEIPVVVQVKNLGAADTYGVLFIHGYDPHIMQVAGGQLPGIGNVNTGGTGSGWYFSLSNVYIGLAGGGTNVNVGFTSPNGNVYGLNAFTANGQLKSMTIRANPGRIGYGLGQKIFSIFTSSNGFGWNAPIALQGDTPDTPGGDMQAYDFPTYIINLPTSLEEFQQPIMVTACYDYATRSTTMICIDPKPTSAVRKPCTPRSVSPGGGQGAPVSVTRIDEISSSLKTVFTIYIHHNKQDTLDELWDLNSLWKCNPEAQTLAKSTDMDVVYVNYVQLSGQPVTCASDGRIRLDSGGNGQISCTAVFDGLTNTAYEAPLEIELWYGYSKSIYKYVDIKRVS
jgi:hypothetical protein